MLTLITGGSASGNSEFAEGLAAAKEGSPHIYIATMYPFDDECRERIRKHQEMRKGKGFLTVECPTDLEDVALPKGSVTLLECLSNLLANELFRPGQEGTEDAPHRICQKILKGVHRLCAQASEVVIVSNEVFSCGILSNGIFSGRTKQSDGPTGGLTANRAAQEEQDKVPRVEDSNQVYLSQLGFLNRQLAKEAGCVAEVVCGIPIFHKGGRG